MKKTLILLFLALSVSLQAQTVKVAAAGNLRYILDEIKLKYAVAHPKTSILVNLGSSGALVQQITNGADFDLFMAADKIYPEKLKAQGIVQGDIKTYAFGKLVIWSNTVDVSKGLDIITDKLVQRIAIAKPDVAPYGARAIECLKYYGLYDKVKNKIVYADNIAQAAQFAQTGNAEIGFIALALAMAPDMKGTYYVLDTKSYKPVEQAMVLMKSWQSNPEAAKFMNFVLSTECKPIFEKYGFIVPSNE
jgi:molybdate transport system substrate-binding protein